MAGIVRKRRLSGAAFVMVLAWLLAGCPEDDGGDFGRCTGEPVPCAELVRGCESQSGCALEDACAGTPTPCGEMISSSSCYEQSGCHWVPACGGVPPPCSEKSYRGYCEAMDGCVWSDLDNSCWGSPTPCREINRFFCAQQDGCYLDGFCDGTPTPCSAERPNFCMVQAGCLAVWGCDGTAAPCASFAYPSVCNAQSGCVWRTD